jgi:hypothetical protein
VVRWFPVVACAISMIAGGVLSAAPARACGGGVATREVDGSVANAQRIVVSIHDGVTDVITQIGVPVTTADYGALLPVPSEPTLDPEPVPNSDLEALDRTTTPSIVVQGSDSVGGEGSGCACGSEEAAGVKSAGGHGDSSVDVSSPVEIGPVTAVVLSAPDGASVRAWLDDNGFAIPTEHEALVDEYSGTGRYFIAIKRSESAATGVPTSVGVHFTLNEEHGELPLRFARLGAASQVTFTVIVAAPDFTIPAAPFVVRTLDDLSAPLLRQSYARAVAEASIRDGELGFVVEGGWIGADLRSVGSLSTLLALGNSRVTRVTTILPRSELTTDAHFTDTIVGDLPPQSRLLSSTVPLGPSSAAALVLAFLLRRPRTRRFVEPTKSA